MCYTLQQTTNQTNGKNQRSAAEHCTSPGIKTPWSLASLRPAPPMYSLKNFGKIDTTTDTSRLPRSCSKIYLALDKYLRMINLSAFRIVFYTYIADERQFEEDAIILKVIEGYCLSVNARFTVHSGESNCKFRIKLRTKLLKKKNKKILITFQHIYIINV